MKFITPKTQFASTMYSGNRLLEDYIYNTKEMLDKKLTENNIPTKDNLTGNQRKTLKNSKDHVTPSQLNRQIKI